MRPAYHVPRVIMFLMARVLLIHWNTAEAEPRLATLRDAGHQPALFLPGTSASTKGLSANPPEAILIDLSRLPSHGSAVAAHFRNRKALRNVPLIFLEGAPEKVERVRQLIPDAVFTTWPKALPALKKSLKAPLPAAPVVPPGAMAGYSGTPLPRKLGIKSGTSALLLEAPDAFEELLEPLPEGVQLSRHPRGLFDRVLFFAASRDEFIRGFDRAASSVAPNGHLWIAWPKKTSRLAFDLSQDLIRAHGMGRLWVDFKICAIDADWSGLCFARR